jgi:acyl-CoA thioester hydrolase
VTLEPPLNTGALGTLSYGEHRYGVTVYYEDTDASGVVYHANYLKYMERARSDLMTLLGLDQRASLEADAADRFYFAVRSVQIEYIRPAFLGDRLEVSSTMTEMGAASGTMTQIIRRRDEIVTEARVRAAFLGAGGRPRRLPPPVRQMFENYLGSGARSG